ncbi:Alginate export [Salinimicrobium catena]|uniref:Alginate export n=1 Tax=Salinimicrobium catena TaxID=390640 RepID=A0A1H5MST9_9FLAO|nr:alginate export family protein [Salinimicrobium catena]SDL27902.1 Alginate export [Salinimicrobium catena]SEE91711.1 Alginate export [Salinimicrobium catena]
MNKKLLLILFCFAVSPIFSQSFEADLQLKPRLEFRNGYKTLLSGEQDPATFVSQRSRLNLLFEQEELEVKLSVQNISVWGEVPTMRTADNNGISLFEAYGQYNFSSSAKLRLGRQVLSYDNERILGEVNWAQQGQSHDAALFSWLPAACHRLDLGVAYNAPSETLFEVPYAINTYQNLQFAWYHLDRDNVGFSFLFMNTGYEYEAANTGGKTDYIQTFGAYHDFLKGDFSGNISAYGQTGQKMGRDLSAWYAGLNLNYALSEAWKIGAGGEYLSGTDMDDTSGELHSFTPLFGTNHAFNGYMDHFYVGNHQNSVGLVDLYGKLTYSKEKFSFSAIPHFFSSAAEITEADSDYLGTEIDLVAGYKLGKNISVNAGYSQMFATGSLEILKGGDKDNTQNWAWLMVNFNPQLFSFSKED